MNPTSDPSPPPNAGWQPLAGLRVLDFSLLLPGPFATVTLADLGADVVKIEPLTGDFARREPVRCSRWPTATSGPWRSILKIRRRGR